jgi:hypothetical protein
MVPIARLTADSASGGEVLAGKRQLVLTHHRYKHMEIDAFFCHCFDLAFIVRTLWYIEKEWNVRNSLAERTISWFSTWVLPFWEDDPSSSRTFYKFKPLFLITASHQTWISLPPMHNGREVYFKQVRSKAHKLSHPGNIPRVAMRTR